MTAEVAVLNSIGVALAADSAVTVGQNAEKIYASADKLFQLHCSAPVGIMVYGSATILGMPWETVIKAFRAKLQNERFGTVAEYANRFIDFLASTPEVFSPQREGRHVEILIGSLFVHIREQLKEAFNEEAEKKEGIKDAEIANTCEKVFRDRLELIRNHPDLPGFGPDEKASIRKEYRSAIRRLKKEIYGELPMTRIASSKLTTIAVEMLSRAYFGPMLGGVVIAGFGETQYLPVLLAFEVEEFVLRKPRIINRQDVSISDDNAGAIIPFAQQDMVHAFMEGADRELMNHIIASTRELFAGVISAVVDFVGMQDAAFARSLDERVTPVQKKAVRSLIANWKQNLERFWQPVVQIVSSLPKDELAAMAESLVNLTKFRRRVTRVRETVGGPIDVAVITKGDGFVWVKRKHYFSADFNPRVIARYHRGG